MIILKLVMVTEWEWLVSVDGSEKGWRKNGEQDPGSHNDLLFQLCTLSYIDSMRTYDFFQYFVAEFKTDLF